MIQVFLNLKRKKAFNHDQCKLPRHCLNIETRTNPFIFTFSQMIHLPHALKSSNFMRNK